MQRSKNYTHEDKKETDLKMTDVRISRPEHFKSMSIFHMFKRTD